MQRLYRQRNMDLGFEYWSSVLCFGAIRRLLIANKFAPTVPIAYAEVAVGADLSAIYRAESKAICSNIRIRPQQAQPRWSPPKVGLGVDWSFQDCVSQDGEPRAPKDGSTAFLERPVDT